jgi:hypothetical protein
MAARRPPPDRRTVPTTIYVPTGLYRWLKNRAYATRVPFTRLVERYCWEGAIREGLVKDSTEEEP